MSYPYINAYQQFFDSSGSPLADGTIEFRDPDTNNLINSYPTADDADAQTNANANPLTLNASAAAASGLYLEDGVKYRVILKNVAGGTVKTDDDVRCPIFSQGAIGLQFYPQTTAESSAGVTPTNYQYEPGNVLRYGTNTTPGTTDMTAAIQAALDSNNVVYIPAGTYLITAQLTMSSNTVVYGDGPISTIQYGANITAGLELDGVSNITIRNFKFDGVRATYTSVAGAAIYGVANGTGCTNIEVSGMHLVDMGGGGVLMLAQTGSHSSNVRLINNYVFNTGTVGLHCQDFVDDTLISGNHVEDFGMNFTDRPGITTGRTAVRHRVTNNYVKCNSSPFAGSTSVHCISMDNCNDFVCNNNVCENAVGYGIELGGAQDGTCVGNSITDCTRACIGVGSSNQDNQRLTISGNTCTNGDGQGIYLLQGAGTNTRDVTITGNVIDTCAGVGIQLDDACLNIVVTGNSVRNCGTSGIYTNVTNGVVITGNRVTGNNTTTNASHGGIRIINTTSETDFLIRDNINTGNGVRNHYINNTYDSAGSEVVTATNVITKAESGKTFYLNSATEFVSTLPAIVGADDLNDGMNYTFIVTAAPSGAAYTIVTASSANIMSGTVSDIVGETVYATAQDLITFADGVSVIGDRVDVESDGTNWYYRAVSGADGGITTGQT